MCLAVPGKILDTSVRNSIRYGRVQFGGIFREVCLDFVPEASIGEYVLVHVGFAISRVNADEASRTYELLQQMGVLEQELSPELLEDGPTPPAREESNAKKGPAA